jgi:hypothetical protein
MCPVCVTTALLIVTGGTSLGGIAAMAAKQFRANAGAEREPIVPSKGDEDDDIPSDPTEGRVPR